MKLGIPEADRIAAVLLHNVLLSVHRAGARP
jgi:hypothetical protein